MSIKCKDGMRRLLLNKKSWGDNMTKHLVLERRVIESLETVGITSVYIPYIRIGTYHRDVFIEDLRRSSTVTPPGIVKWEDILAKLEAGHFIRIVGVNIVVDREFTTPVITDRLERVPVERPVLREVPTMVGILRWAAYKQNDVYHRVKELLVYWTPEHELIVDNEDVKNVFFRVLLECTPVLRRFAPPFDTLDGLMEPTFGFGYPYSSAPNRGKTIFEVSDVAGEVGDGFVEYNDYDIDEFNEGLELVKAGDMDIEDLKLRARGGRYARASDVEHGRARREGQIIGGGESYIIDVNECLKNLWAEYKIAPREVLKIGRSE